MHNTLITEVIPPLLVVICDYVYYSKYEKYASYTSTLLDAKTKDYASFIYKNYFIEHANNMIYISDIFTKRNLRTYDIYGENEISGWTMFWIRFSYKKYFSLSTNPEELFMNMNMGNDEKTLKLTIKIKLKQQLVNISNIVIHRWSKEKKIKLEDLVDIKKVKSELIVLCGNNDITLMNDVYNVNSKNILVSIFFVGIMKNMHVLEYDMIEKRITANYILIKGYSTYDSNTFGEFSFEADGEILNIIHPNMRTASKYKLRHEI